MLLGDSLNTENVSAISDEVTSAVHQGRSIHIPYVTTHPVVDLSLSFILTPLWCALGFEQFIFPILTSWIALRVLLIKRTAIIICPHIRWLLLFLGAQILSAFFIEEGVRAVTFLRTFSTYITALM